MCVICLALPQTIWLHWTMRDAGFLIVDGDWRRVDNMAQAQAHYSDGTPAPWDSGYFGPDGKGVRVDEEVTHDGVESWGE